MYPYSEFIQKNIMKNNNLNTIGKVNKDPRITPFGRFIRKYWLDEIPQIYDWLRGEIKLVGIRALSYPFYEQYPDKYKKLYLNVKPGLICPLFDKNTNGFEDIVKIEQEYIEQYLRNPIATDFKYFFKALFQIIAGVRSV